MGCEKSLPIEPLLKKQESAPTPLSGPRRSLTNKFVSKSQGSISDHYRILKALSTTKLGTILHGENKQTGTVRAIREVNKNSGNTSAIANEVAILGELDHPNIVKIFQIIETSINFYIVYELLEGGNLQSRIKKSGNEVLVSKYMHDIVSAIFYMHIHGVVHCDLNPSNILFSSEDSEGIPKIIGFSSAQKLSEKITVKTENLTTMYASPDIMQKKVTEKCDVWSLGVMIYELLVGKGPFVIKEKKLKYDKDEIFDFTNPGFLNLSFNAQDLIKKLLKTNPNERLSIKDILAHPWLAQSNKEFFINYEALHKLRTFKIRSNIGREILKLIIFKVNLEEKEIVNLFKKVDTDFDGIISKEEVVEVFQQIGVDATNEIDKIMENLDFNNNGNLEFSEIKIALVDWEKEIKKKLLVKVFETEAGKIKIITLKHQFADILPHEWKDFTKKVKAEQGQVSIENLKAYIKSVIQ